MRAVHLTGETESGRMRSRGMQYRRLMLLGTGGMATVHLALAMGPSGFNRLVVVKAMREELLDEPDARAMFLEEARLCARLNHPNVVQVSEVVDSAAGVMIVMEYLDGRPLSGIYQVGDGFTLPMRLRVVCEVLAGLHYVHELRDFEGEALGLVHRDVSPHNVFVTFDGRVKLLDFGIAKATYASEHTKTGIVKGKLTYMPAEQLRGQPVDRRTDIYSIGCILWEAIAGGRIWAKLPDKEIMSCVLQGKFPKLSSRVDVDPRLEAIVSRATALDPSQRYATAEAMRLELEELLHTVSPVSTRDIGEFLSAEFAEANQRRDAEVAQLIAALPEGTGPVASGLNEVIPLLVSDRPPTAPTQRARPKNRWVFVALALALASGALVGVLELTRKPGGSAVKSATAPALPAQVVFSVAVLPQTARVSIDGDAPSVGGVRLSVAPGAHVVRVESDGYSTEERHVNLVKDTSLTVELSSQPESASSDALPSAVLGSPARRSPHKPVKNHSLKPTLTREAASETVIQPAPAAPPAANCSPPYYFVGGIKTFKPECI